MMGFHISISELDNMVEGVYTSINNWKTQLLDVRDKINEFINDEELTGEGADSIKANLSSVYIYAIDAMISALTAYNTQLGLYADGVYSIESDRKGVLDEENLNEICGKLEELIEATEGTYDCYENSVFDVSDQVDVELLSKATYTDQLAEEKTRIEDEIIEKVTGLDDGVGGCNSGTTNSIADLIDGVNEILNSAKASKLSLCSPEYTELLNNVDTNNLDDKKNKLDEYSIKNRESVVDMYDKNELCDYDYKLFDNSNLSKLKSAIIEIITGDGSNIATFLIENKDLSLDELVDKIMKFVPQGVDEETVLEVLEDLSGGLSASTVSEHHSWNTTIWEVLKDSDTLETLEDKATIHDKINNTDYIEYQGKLTQMEYGEEEKILTDNLLKGDTKLSANDNTCEVIAVYNTLMSLNNTKYSFPDLISIFEKKGIALNGYFGTSPKQLNSFLKTEGYDTEMYSGDEVSYEKLQDNFESYVVTVYNDKDNLESMIHTMSVTKVYIESEDKYLYKLHNADSKTGFIESDSLESVVGLYNDGKAQVISIIGVKGEEDN